MTGRTIDAAFAGALRQELISKVERHARLRRRLSWRLSASIATAAVLAGGGVAYAAGLLTLPGAASNTPLGTITTVTRTGTATINLGPVPAGARDVSLSLTCLSAATFDFPGGNLSCSAADLRHPAKYRRASIVVPLHPRQHTITVDTTANARWTLQAMYVHQVTTAWGTNAHGQTYGVANKNGTPDLVAVAIDHGKTQGYVKASEMNCASGRDVASPAQALAWDKASAKRNISIPVYKSNGTTVIGTFVVGSASGPGTRTVPLASLPLGCATSPTSPTLPAG
ncbi:MAG: peptidase M56 family protein [Acidimicrobiales bacterium]